MSKFTGSLFHKPSPFDSFPSPPETYSDTFPPNLQSLGHSFATESAGTRFRKSSPIPYHASSLRHNKEKGQRSSAKYLIIVIPPPTLVYDNGHFTHRLSNGPFHRLSEGVAMPLFPSMITQLAAIAREFNFPSTSGLCLYFHHVEDGLTMKPRITDDSWPSIWSYLSDTLSPDERRPLISGKVEFDIDIRVARWYASWLSTIHRELFDCHSHTFPSTGPSLAHFRGDSQATLPEGRSFENDVAEHSFTHPSEHNHRHVPKKLSLAERFDLVPLRPDMKPNSQPALSPPDVQSTGSQVLSTIVQEEEAETSRGALDTRIKSWRESALLIPNSLATTGQTSLDLANLPNDMPITNELVPALSELKMEDFAWSISSAGPKSCDSPSSVSEVRIPSVHLASRIAGTVHSTPSVCTSFGPDSYDCTSPSSWGRAPSIHIASRLAGSVCTSPSICTSFGPEGDTPLSPFLDIYRVSTPDFTQRLYESMPPTPQTATTWGAPLSYPPSPRCPSPSPSLDLGERSMSIEFEMSLPSPPDDPSSVVVWPHINKYSTKSRLPTVASRGIETINSTFNYLSSYNPVYPYLEMYPPIPGTMATRSQRTPASTPNSTLDINVGFKIPSVYPSFDIYPAVYPFNLQQIYPSILVPMVVVSQDISDVIPDSPLETKVEFKTSCVYPTFYLYPAVYPYNLEDIYPVIVVQNCTVESPEDLPRHFSHDHAALTLPIGQDVVLQTNMSQSIHLRKYPIFNIYPAVYPFFDLYPVDACEEAHAPAYGLNCELLLSTTVEPVYPFFNLYPPVYPHLEIYPAHLVTAYQPTLEQDKVSPIGHTDGWSQQNLEQDPTFNQDLRQSSRLTDCTYYPYFNLYPAIYPHFDLYPAPGGAIALSQPATPELLRSSCLLSNTAERLYPTFHLYPAVYPYFDLYLPLPEWETHCPSTLENKQAKSNSRSTHAELHAMVEVEITERARLFGQVEGMEKFEANYLGLDVHGNCKESSSSSIIHHQTLSSSRPLRDIFGGGTLAYPQNIDRQTEMPPSQKVENSYKAESPGRRDSVVWQRIKEFDSNGLGGI